MLPENFSVFFAEGEFGAVAHWSGGSLNGIFERNYQRQLHMQTQAPAFLLASGQVPDDIVGQSITVDGQLYECVDVEPGETGLSALILALV